MPTNKKQSRPSRTFCASDTLLSDKDGPGVRRENRTFARHAIERCRSIAIRRLDGSGKPCGRWFLADIVNMAEGGMCLIASEEQSLEVGQWLLLDLRSHPGFGQLRMQAQLRWLTGSHFALTVGVAFATSLKEVPALAVEQRSIRRDPNQEDWALQEEQELATP